MFLFNFCPPKGPWPLPPWCKTEYERYSYNIKVEADKLPQIKAINMYDTWGRNYNMGMFETTWSNIDPSFERVKELGAKEVYIHDFDRAIYSGKTDYKSTNYTLVDDIFWNDMRDQAISKSDLTKLASIAHKDGMKIGIKRNLSFMDMSNILVAGFSGNISSETSKNYSDFNSTHTEEWIKDFFNKWQSRLLEKAQIYNDAGIDIMSVSPQFQKPTFAGHEELANTLWLNLIVELKKKFKGEIMADLDIYGLIDGYNGQENWKKYDYYKSADIIEVKAYAIPKKYYKKGNIGDSMMEMLSDINTKAGNLGVKISFFFAPSSYENSIVSGPVEFLDIKNSSIQKLKKDYEEQAQDYEYLFKYISNKNNITRINVGNFAWDDAIDPKVKPLISISASFRNKPAEEVIKIWFNK